MHGRSTEQAEFGQKVRQLGVRPGDQVTIRMWPYGLLARAYVQYVELSWNPARTSSVTKPSCLLTTHCGSSQTVRCTVLATNIGSITTISNPYFLSIGNYGTRVPKISGWQSRRLKPSQTKSENASGAKWINGRCERSKNCRNSPGPALCSHATFRLIVTQRI